MTARKPVDPRLDVQIPDRARERVPAEQPISPDPRADLASDEEARHENVEVEIGPVDREDEARDRP